MTAASSGSMSTHSPSSCALKRLSAESGRHVLSARFTASNRAWIPSRSADSSAGATPTTLAVHALPIVSPLSSVSRATGRAAHPASTRQRTSSARAKLLRQHFEGGVVIRAPLLDLRGGRGLVLDAGIEPVETRGRPRDGELALRVRLDQQWVRRIAIPRAARDDLHVQTNGRLAVEQESELRGL